MAYVKIIYQNSPSTATPINAENLNHMDDQIALNDQRLTEIENSYVKSFNGRKGEVTPQVGDYDISQIAPTSGATVGQIPIVRNDGTEEDPNLTFHMEDVPSSGHVIKDQSGTSLAQEDALQFADSFVSDDSLNGRTVVENVKEVAPADYASTTDEGIIVTDDGDDALIGPVSDDYVEVTADGVKTYQALLNEIFNDPKFDITKISEKSTLKIDPFVLYFGSFGNNSVTFNGSAPNGNNAFVELSATIETSNSVYNWMNVATSGTTSTNKSTDQPTSGTKITLYYGNKKAIVDLQTTANRCLMGDGSTVQSAIDSISTTDNTTLKTEEFRNTHTSLETAYIAETDGYVCLHNNSGQSATISLYNQSLILGGVQGDFCLFVKKGCKMFVNGTSAWAFFRSFN